VNGRLWWHRDFLLLWAGQTVSDVGTAISTVVLPLIAVVSLHAGGVAVGALNAAEWVPWLLIGLPTGVWVDRARRKRLMIACDGLRATLLASIPAAAAVGALHLGQLFAIAFGVGLATVVFQVAYQAYPPVLVDREHLAEANAKLIGSGSAAQLAGPGIGGLLVQAVRAPYAIVADAVSYLVSAVALLLIRTPDPVTPVQTREPIRRSIATGIRFVRHDPLLRVMTVAPAVSNLFFGGYEAIVVLFLVRSVDLEPSVVGLLVGLTSGGSLLGAAIARPVGRRIGTARALWLSSALTAPLGLLAALTTRGAGIVLFIAGNVAVLVGVLIYNVTISAFRQGYCPPEMLGRVIASMRFVLFGTIPLGSLGAGALASLIGPRAAVGAMLAGNLIATALLIFSPLRTMRDLPDRPASLPETPAATAHT
jgi:hypothetical protein